MIEASYLADLRDELQKYRMLAERALAQVSDHDFFGVPAPESTSLAVIVKHMAGNLRSRWRDMLTTDGEKPDRNRDGEFVIDGAGDSRAALMARWEEGWSIAFDTLGALGPADLSKTVLIRAEPHRVVQALQRQLAHAAYHVGQIVYIARYFAGAGWQTLSIARGQSGQFNEQMRARFGSAGHDSPPAAG